MNPKDLLWDFACRSNRLKFSGYLDEGQIFHSWKIYNALFWEKVKTKTLVSILPAINARPTEISTVYTTLMKGKSTAAACIQDYHIHTEDQHLYALFQIVKFAFPETFPGCTNQMGGFHTCNVFIDCINKLWGDTLYDMLVESGVNAPNTAQHMLEGKEFQEHGASHCVTKYY
ncbi:hypothetical protein QAD02_020349 [Eretmocerus hayati]|uniref:Uncharacterized protein n=1 Tax=Eretmocerus hayati TaxID=131215 RepID=A0ACC2PM84_9HYME|nr:hypothetical protein QAD02_020349 [Eretmocerus hayati]